MSISIKVRTSRLPDGSPIALEGAFVLRKDALGSKGQPDRKLPMLPVVRAAFVEAWNHRRDETSWVIWNWRDGRIPSTYGSMNQQLKKLERSADVPHIKGRAFHAFRRSLATVLVERLSVSHASGWLGDTVEVLLRSYVKPSVEAQGEAAAYLMHLWNEEIDPQQPNARYPKSVPV